MKMFLRGRPITMYIPSGIRSLEELPSGPPPETLSLDWVYPAPFNPLATTLPIMNPPHPLLFYDFLLGLQGEGDLPIYPLPVALLAGALSFSSFPLCALDPTLSLTMIPTPGMGTGVVTPALICLCCALGRWSTLSPVWWCCTGLGEALGALEVVARDITGGTRTVFDGEGPRAGEWAAQGVGRVGLAERGSWVDVEKQERRVNLLLCRPRDGVLGGLERPTPFPRVSPPPLSLAVHPDGVRVASGQTAGVDKDGKVRPQSNTRVRSRPGPPSHP